MDRNDWWAAVLIGVLVLLFVPFVFMMGGWMAHWTMGPGMMFFWWPFMFLIPLMLIGLIVLAAYYLGSWGRRGTYSYGRVEDDALRVLRERYARGEITEEQYRKMREELRS